MWITKIESNWKIRPRVSFKGYLRIPILTDKNIKLKHLLRIKHTPNICDCHPPSDEFAKTKSPWCGDGCIQLLIGISTDVYEESVMVGEETPGMSASK
jgi:hypothetical protein